jgi:hypothetical protein
MRWLKREEGVSIVLVALLLVVLLAAAGIAVDLGRLYLERRELRTGADAAVLAIASDCVSETKPCDTNTALATAGAYANANAYDLTAGVESLELDLVGQTVRLETFAVDPSNGERGVEVPLMSLLGFGRMNVEGYAAAEWGFAGAGYGIPIVIEECEFDKAGTFNEVYLSLFVGGGVPDMNDPEACPADPAHKDAPGAFGWLVPEGGECEVWVEEGVEEPADPGHGAGRPPRECDASYITSLLYQDVVVPIFSSVSGQGSGTRYQIAGLAAFRITGLDLGSKQFTAPDGFKCPTEQGQAAIMCLRGEFTSTELSFGDTGGEDFGVTVVKLIE